MSTLYYEDSATAGEPVLLLHAFGLSGRIWEPVVPMLATDMRVIVVDLPGHRRSPLPTDGTEPNPKGYAQSIARLLDDLGIDRIHIAGNSIGGWTALELALLDRAKSVTALSPAGLWPNDGSLVREVRFVAESTAARLSRPMMRTLLSTRQGRKLILGEAMKTAPDLTTAQAVGIVSDYASVHNIVAHVRSHYRRKFMDGGSLTIPVTVAWGAEDRFIPVKARSRSSLPAHAQWFDLPGCGHVMMYDAPDLVAETIRSTVRSAE